MDEIVFEKGTIVRWLENDLGNSLSDDQRKMRGKVLRTSWPGEAVLVRWRGEYGFRDWAQPDEITEVSAIERLAALAGGARIGV